MTNLVIKRFASTVQQPSNWLITAYFCLCVYSAAQWVDHHPIVLTAVADAAETSVPVSSASRPENVPRPESKSECPSQTVLTPIEDLRVGMRVRADSPNGEIDDQFGDEVIPSEWRKLTLTSPKRNGTVSHITLLRPLEWIEQEKAVVDGHVYISVPECGIDGNACIHAIGPCPEIPEGEGQVITGTFRHQAEGGVELSIEGEPEPIRCTGNHPFWSEDKQQFVRADRLEIGEGLRTEVGLTRLNSAANILGQQTVYNIEVFQNHVYHVGNAGVLVHNGGEGNLPILSNCPYTDALVLGKGQFVRKWAEQLGGRHVMDETDWAEQVIAAAKDKSAKIIVTLDGLRGKGVEEKVRLGIEKAKAAGGSTAGGFTAWELLQLEKYGRLQDVLFFDHGAFKANPFF